MSAFARWLALTFLLLWSPAKAEPPLLMGFYESWSERPGAPPPATRLANLPQHLDILALGFARPDLSYSGDNDLTATGLEMPFGVAETAEALALFRQRSPRTRILLSLGGATYDRGDAFAPEAAARLVAALGIDGVDLDYEPTDPGCHPRPERNDIVCESDAVWAEIIRRTRTHLPRPALVTAQAWSVGAYGTGRFADAVPAARHTGSMLWLGREAVAAELDLVAIMAYGAGRRFDPLLAFAAYRDIWPGRLLLGARIGGTGGGGPPATASTLTRYAKEMARDPRAGVMLYTLAAGTSHRPSRASLDGRAAVATVCRTWDRTECASPVKER